MAKQEIIAPVLQVVSRAIESVTFRNAYVDGQEEPRGSINVTNNYEGAVEQPDDSVAYQLTMTLSVTPEHDDAYYALEITASALFAPVDGALGKDEIQHAVLSAGAQNLYGYVTELASRLTHDGALGEMTFPMLMFEARDEEPEVEDDLPVFPEGELESVEGEPRSLKSEPGVEGDGPDAADSSSEPEDAQ